MVQTDQCLINALWWQTTTLIDSFYNEPSCFDLNAYSCRSLFISKNVLNYRKIYNYIHILVKMKKNSFYHCSVAGIEIYIDVIFCVGYILP